MFFSIQKKSPRILILSIILESLKNTLLMNVVVSENIMPLNSFDLLNVVENRNGKALSSYPYSRAIFPGAYVDHVK